MKRILIEPGRMTGHREDCFTHPAILKLFDRSLTDCDIKENNFFLLSPDVMSGHSFFLLRRKVGEKKGE
ncbi:MAG: hypothetical protein A2374_04745 [Candidatus Moranbacteria bacterium RIFOXYB1_FULL_44_23]|nr:MAG: hypothetical protein A2407_03015 [Candidatus Moranbacteria bacterium RIFOXYC1_FULL_44_8]OGI39065.1 MAG: hypothetical protein A2374_04745 [Candidatus Moranbacteria bacterium RIFOXYB1_FULL_44_23]HBB36638.1 hypothetical protein [Candidatus Moranbacteria bacterium]HBU25427.1 hypothetical protein [Candidatus Moranbacteria bacterium]